MHILSLIFLASVSAVAGQEPADQPQAKLVLEVTKWEDGSPLVGAKVAAHWGVRFVRTGDAFGKREGKSARAQTDDAGRCELPVQALEDVLVYIKGGEQTRLRRLLISGSLNPGETRVVKVQVYPRSIAVRGVVVDRDGNPVPGARVQAAWGSDRYRQRYKVTREELQQRPDAPPLQECIADQEGNFELTVPDAPVFIRKFRSEWVLSAKAEGMGPIHRLRFSPLDVGPVVEFLTLQISKTREILGNVIGEDGHPATDTTIKVKEFDLSARMETEIPGVDRIQPAPLEGSPFYTDLDGNFRIPNLPVGRWFLSFRVEGHRGTEKLEIQPDDTTATLSLVRHGDDRLLDLEGQVVNSDGQPIAGVQFQYRRWGVMPQTTDKSGHFRIPNFRPEDLGRGLKFYAPGYVVGGIMLPKKRNDVRPLSLVLQPELTIQGRVVGPDGEPRTGLQIYASAIEPDGADWPFWKIGNPQNDFDLARVLSDREGHFSLVSLWPGQWRLQVSKGSMIRAEVLAYQIVEAGSEDLVIQIGDNMVSVEGQLIDAGTGKPIREYSVVPVEYMSRSSVRGHSEMKLQINDVEGRFRFPSLAKGTWAFGFEAEGYRTEETRRMQLPTEGEILTFELARTTNLRVLIHDSLGKPVQYAVLDAIGLNGDTLAVQTVEPLGMTNETGQVDLRKLPRGEITLLVWPIWSFRSFRFPVDLTIEQPVPLKLTLPGDFSSPRQAVEVKLRTSTGKPVTESVYLMATNADDAAVACWSLNYWSKKYSVVPGHDLSPYFLQIPPPEDSIVPFELPPGRYRITIRGKGWSQTGPEVLIEAGKEPKGVTISVDALPK
jgi:uncharacterized GH25 family protein